MRLRVRDSAPDVTEYDLAYDGDDVATIDLTLRPFYCILAF